MLHHWKVFDLDITDFKYYHGPTYSSETIPSENSNP